MENRSTPFAITFDFDHWMKMARDHPDAFERYREEAIEDFLASLPLHRRSRLQHLQWRIDMEISRHASPMGACIKLHQLMMESLDKQKAALDGLLTCDTNQPSRASSTSPGRVIPFTPRNQS